MAANGISELATKALKQAAKLAKATAKRQGKTVADNGTITGAIDSTKNYYRARNTLDITQLPTQYSGNSLTDNANVGGLVEGRPWTTTAPAPTYYVGTIDSSIGNPFSFKVLKSANTGMAAAIANVGWVLTWTDIRFDNGGFTAPQVNVRTQTGSGFTSGSMTTDSTHYNFTSWFGASQIPLGTEFTINWS